MNPIPRYIGVSPKIPLPDTPIFRGLATYLKNDDVGKYCAVYGSYKDGSVLGLMFC